MSNNVYRYPGSRPFEDTYLDRLLFFGREEEKQALLHKILARRLVVLFAKSGLGKTSLINAGVSQLLRENDCVPLRVRFNDTAVNPLEAVFSGIKKTVEEHKIDYEKGEEKTLWQYFKTAAFWSSKDSLLTPVLILDQFEEFFTFHSAEHRKAFILQLADLVNGSIPLELRQSMEVGKPFHYSDSPPDVKILISIREDFLGQLDELSADIPDILNNRFRLLALTREQARDAIIKPSRVQDEALRAVSFTFAPEAVDTMLEFLCKRKERENTKMTDEVESFQLQLLCSHFELKVGDKERKEGIDIIIKKKDLGGESGMRKVLQQFYDDQIGLLGSKMEKKRVRKLCEVGLISIKDRRLSLEEEEITRKFNVSKTLLENLVNRRLLRAEPRVGSVYYELSHDTLVAAIRESQKERITKRNSINKLYEEAGELKTNLDYEGASRKYEDILKIDETYVKAYLELGQIFYKISNYDKAIEIYNRAIKNRIKDARIYHYLGNALFAAGKTEEAIQNLEESIKLDPNLSMALESLGKVHASKKDFKKAIKYYYDALNIDKKNPGIYRELAVSYIKDSEADRAIEVFQEAIKVNPGYADIYEKIAEALKEKGEEKYIGRIYELTFQSGSQNAFHYLKLGNDYYELKKYNEAIAAYKKAIELEPKYALAYNNIGLALRMQGNCNEAIDAFQKAIELDPKFSIAYNNMGTILYRHNKYNEAIAAYKKAIELDSAYIIARINLAEVFLHTGHFDDAFKLVNELLKEKDILTQLILTMRFIVISSMVFQGKQAEAAVELKKFIEYYRTIPGEYEREWSYTTTKEFITGNKQLTPEQEKLLLQLIDLLESPKKEGDKKLKELL